MLPLAMTTGIMAGILYPAFIVRWATLLTPGLISLMLLITYCKASLHEMKLTPMHGWMIASQILGGLAAFALLFPWNPIVAEGVFICFFCPTANAAPVIAGMLGGNVYTLITYNLLSNLTVALLAPVIFSFMGTHAELSFLSSILLIAQKVLPLLLLPLVGALLLRQFLPRVHYALKNRQTLTFYLWIVSLTLVVGNAVSFIIQQGKEALAIELAIAALSLIVCMGQFYIGRKIGRHYGDKIAGGQGLGQKNTVLAIWLAIAYLSPIASIGPASYIIWQNCINSLQLYLKGRKEMGISKEKD